MEIEQLIVLLLEANIIGALMLFSFYEKKISKKNPQNPLEKLILSFEKKTEKFVCFFFWQKTGAESNDAGGAPEATPAARLVTGLPPERPGLMSRTSSRTSVANGSFFFCFFYRTRTRKRERERAIKRERSISGRDCHRRPWINVIAAGSEKPSKKTQSNPVRGSGKRI